MVSEAPEFSGVRISFLDSLNRYQNQGGKNLLQKCQRPLGIGISLGREAAQFLGNVGEIIPIGGYFNDGKAMSRQVVFVEIPVEPSIEMIGGHMRQAAERGGQDKSTARLEKSGKLGQRLQGLGEVLEHLGAENGSERCIRLRNGRDVADNVAVGGFPRSRLLPHAVSMAIVFPEILGNIAKMGAEFPEDSLPGTGVQKAGSGWDQLQRSLDPHRSGGFIS